MDCFVYDTGCQHRSGTLPEEVVRRMIASLDFVSLRRFDFTLISIDTEGIFIDDQIVNNIATSCPSLRTLQLRSPPNKSLPTSFITLDSLHHLARRCPNLETLELRLLLDGVELGGPAPPSFQRLCEMVLAIEVNTDAVPRSHFRFVVAEIDGYLTLNASTLALALALALA
ncbi:hypothetical protein FRC03_012154, partial [Tulasnella sp. 419]